MNMTHPDILFIERTGMTPQQYRDDRKGPDLFECECGAEVSKLYKCDFCGRKCCKACYKGSEQEVGGGIDAQGSNLTVCYLCAEEDEVQNEIRTAKL